MKTSINISDFTFKFSGWGHYKATYTSPITDRSWTTIIDYMPIIDATKNEDYPKIKDLNTLKRYCKK